MPSPELRGIAIAFGIIVFVLACLILWAEGPSTEINNLAKFREAAIGRTADLEVQIIETKKLNPLVMLYNITDGTDTLWVSGKSSKYLGKSRQTLAITRCEEGRGDWKGVLGKIN